MIEWKEAEFTSFYEEDRPSHITIDRVEIHIYVDVGKRLKRMCRLRVNRSDDGYKGKFEVLRIKPKNDPLSGIWTRDDAPYCKVTNLLRSGGVLALTNYLGVIPIGKPHLLAPSEAFKTSIFQE